MADGMMDDVGIYLHVPFCERICPYCDFAVVARRRVESSEEVRLVTALEKELVARAPAFAGRRVATVYFGGGTPSLLRPESIARLLEACRAAFPGTAPDEVTLEVNPSTVERERIRGFVEAGARRLSIGVQSFDDRVLQRLGRAHRADEAVSMIDAVQRAGVDSFSLDLIFGVAGQERDDVRVDVERAVALGPDHVSAYGLTVETGTPLATGVERGQIQLPDDDDVADMMRDVADGLEGAGLLRYETSSYARPGREAKHNRRYWQRAPVLGIGVGAHSSQPATDAAPFGTRTANERDLSSWFARVEQGDAARPPEAEVLGRREAEAEAAFLALRTREGLSRRRFRDEFGIDPERRWPVLADFVRQHWMSFEGEHWRLTAEGWLLSDGLFEQFV